MSPVFINAGLHGLLSQFFAMHRVDGIEDSFTRPVRVNQSADCKAVQCSKFVSTLWSEVSQPTDRSCS